MIYWIFSFVLTAIDTWCVLYLLDTFLKKKDAGKLEKFRFVLFYGANILVAPICHPHATSREVYLPAGAEWTHAGTGEIFEGGRSYKIEATIETLPIFLRDGQESYLIGKI